MMGAGRFLIFSMVGNFHNTKLKKALYDVPPAGPQNVKMELPYDPAILL